VALAASYGGGREQCVGGEGGCGEEVSSTLVQDTSNRYLTNMSIPFDFVRLLSTAFDFVRLCSTLFNFFRLLSTSFYFAF
jgi:hypothetical protein